MSSRLIWAVNALLIGAIVALVAWAFPYGVSAYHLAVARRALPEDGSEGFSPFIAFGHVLKALRWDAENEQATELLTWLAHDVVPAFAEGGEWSRVRAACNAILVQDPENQLARFYRARALEETGEDRQAAAIYGELRYLELEAGGEPPAHLGELMMRLDRYGVWSPERMVDVVSYLVWREGDPQAEDLLSYLAETYPDDARWPLYRGDLFRLQGRGEQAEASYREALAVDPQCAQALLRLGMLSGEAGGPSSDAAAWYRRYHELVDGDLLALKRLAEVCAAMENSGVLDGACRAAAESTVGDDLPEDARAADLLWAAWRQRVREADPQYTIGQELDSGWTILGYDVDEGRLIRGEAVDLLLYWAGPRAAEAGAEDEGWYRAGDRWAQVLEEVSSLVFNGGFELGSVNGSPAGFPKDIYRAGASTRRLAMGTRGGRQTTVGLLANTEVDDRTSLVSGEIPIRGDALYLQAGWMRGEDGSGALGRRWIGSTPQGVRNHDYVVGSASPEAWQHYAAVAQPLDGARGCQVWLLNFESTGRVYFDNVLFVGIGRPGG
jgi:tetratricopeptide (TPR) repeat protein